LEASALLELIVEKGSVIPIPDLRLASTVGTCDFDEQP
jgi:hypothetical protein